MSTSFAYSPKTLRVTGMTTYAMSVNYNYWKDFWTQTGHIYDITNLYNPNKSEHFEYDRWYRLTAYWISNGRGDPFSDKMTWSYDRYGNVLTYSRYDPLNCPDPDPDQMCEGTYGVNTATNRLTSFWGPGMGYGGYSYDAAGNMTSVGAFDAENRPKWAMGKGFLYDASGRRFRRQWSTGKVNYIYSVTGLLLMEDKVSDSTWNNLIYFNGQLVALHPQDDYFRLLFKDHLGSTRSVVKVRLPESWDWMNNWGATEFYDYAPYGMIRASSVYDPVPTSFQYTGKPRESWELDYFGARYYMHNFAFRWISTDPVTARIYDPPILNKYTYVRNDPVNLVDPDGRDAVCWSVYEVEYDDGLPWVNYAGIACAGFPSSGGTGKDASLRCVGAGCGGAGSATTGEWSTTWDFGKHKECSDYVTSLGVNPEHIPSLDAARWVVDAYLVTSASPDVVAAIWSVESAYRMTMFFSENKNDKGEVWSRDWGPLQLNDYWKLDRPAWNKLYNPNGDNLKEGGNPFLSLIAAAHDLADHGARQGDFRAAVAYWHSSKTGVATLEYGVKVGERQAGLYLFFKCLNGLR